MYGLQAGMVSLGGDSHSPPDAKFLNYRFKLLCLYVAIDRITNASILEQADTTSTEAHIVKSQLS